MSFTHSFLRFCIRRCHRFVLYIHPDLLRAMQVDEVTIKSKVLMLPNGVDGAYLEEIGEIGKKKDQEIMEI